MQGKLNSKKLSKNICLHNDKQDSVVVGRHPPGLIHRCVQVTEQSGQQKAGPVQICVKEEGILNTSKGHECGEGNGTPLQHSCLENPMDGGPGGPQSMGSLRVGHD